MSLWELWLDNMRQAEHWHTSAKSYFTMARCFRELGDERHAESLTRTAKTALEHGRRQVQFAKQNRFYAVQFERWP